MFNILLLALMLPLAGCSSIRAWLRPEPAPQTSFLDGSGNLVEQSPEFPFRKIWIDRDTDLKKFSKIIVAPVNTNHLAEASGWDKVQGRTVVGDVNEDSSEIAKYMQDSFRKALYNDPRRRFIVVDKPGPDTLRLELALVQLVPSKADLNVAENVVGFIVWPVGFLTVFNSGSTAFEGVLRDARTGKIVCSFVDREKDEPAVVNLPGFTYYGNARYFIDRWSRQFVDFMNAEDYGKLKTDFPLKLIVF
jgi:hypothetical protein